MAQAGVKDFDASTWFGLLAPAGTDRQVTAKLSAAMAEVLQQPDIRKTLTNQGALVRGGTPADFRKFFLSEYERWGKVVKTAGVKAE
jgi:tripartite-type tricarboxylate transporter receptor subunit TctC